MSTPDLYAIQARADAATEGPWHIDGEPDEAKYIITYTSGGGVVVGTYVTDLVETDEDANFIAAARTDVRDLLAYARDLEARIGRVREMHIPVMEDGNEVGCAMCDWEHPEGCAWPCGTLAALTATDAS